MSMDPYADVNEERKERYWQLLKIGTALSAERDHGRLVERILLSAKELTNADAGTVYMVSRDRHELHFMVMVNDTMGVALGGSTGNPVPFPPVRLTLPDGSPNHAHVAAAAAMTGDTINIADAYDVTNFDFSGTRAYDALTGYRSKSFLTVPLKNHQGTVVGVLQLINARSRGGDVEPFMSEQELLIATLASQAAVALDNQMMIEAQKELFRSLLQVVGAAIDAKSAYTGGHCHRVPELTTMLARAAHEAEDGKFAAFHMTDDDWYELEVAGGLHDCGKVITKEHVVDKATKLETIYNRIHEIRMRFEVVKRDAEIDCLKAVAAGGNEPALRADCDARLRRLDDDFAFVAECNMGGEFMAPERIARLKEIAATTWLRTIDDRLGISWEEASRMAQTPAALPVVEHLLADKPHHIVPHDGEPPPADNPWGFIVKPPAHQFNRGEIYNLSIGRGTLTAEERYHINDHIMQTIMMLETLPFPKNLSRVAAWAGGHHEKMDGTGYPRGLTGEQMSIPARIMAIADIFEALTAADRPYKARKTLSESIEIMARMSREQHIDPDLFELFLTSGVYRAYGNRFLLPDQIDEVEITRYLRPPAGASAAA